MLVGILLLLSSAVYAYDISISDISQIAINPEITQQITQLPVITPLQLKSTDLLVEAVANIPENLKVGGTFWVDIYVTFGGSPEQGPNEIYSANLKLASSDPAVADFLSGENGDLFSGGNTYVNGLYSHSSSTATPIKNLVRYNLGRLQMQTKAKGTFSITVDKSKSSATYFQAPAMPFDYYNLVINPTVITKVVDAVCVPLTVTCPEQVCGLVPDGCGGVITCDCTACTAKHTCILPIYLFPQNNETGNKQLCEAAINSAGADKDALKGISYAFQGKDTGSKSLEGCPGEDCVIYKVSAIVNVLTNWFSKQK